MHCPSCQADNPAQAKFCFECGTRLALRCPACGTEARPDHKFCGECGALLKGPAAPPTLGSTSGAPAGDPPASSERKQVTILAGGLTAVRRDGLVIDPDTRHALLQRFFELARLEIGGYEGTPHLLPTGGFLAVFGAPVAHEDHPRRAVLAALGLRAAFEAERAELAAREHIEVSLQLGLETGSVIVGGAATCRSVRRSSRH
ncbi:MAG: zinc-ribbon domain-containing protein [Thermoanaerobaculia bacterium]|nr:zinc-ribbon domain-containing protein [Thermoanaerobaculia bacterium]